MVDRQVRNQLTEFAYFLLDTAGRSCQGQRITVDHGKWPLFGDSRDTKQSCQGVDYAEQMTRMLPNPLKETYLHTVLQQSWRYTPKIFAWSGSRLCGMGWLCGSSLIMRSIVDWRREGKDSRIWRKRMKMRMLRVWVGKRFRRVRLVLVGDASEIDPAPAYVYRVCVCLAPA